MVISRWILLTIRNVLDKSCRENQNTHFCSVAFLQKSFRLWDNVEKSGREIDRTKMAIWRRVAWWIGKATRAQVHARARAPTHVLTRTHSQKVVILIALPQQQWLRERAWIFRYTSIDCDFSCNFSFPVVILVWISALSCRELLTARLSHVSYESVKFSKYIRGLLSWTA
jgi:hypothetical protein